jgi:Arc/MetJ-type ribon-helix-helix transcriptional regulator
MTINLPRDLESSVRAEVLSGHFASEDDMVAAAVRAYLRQRPQEQLTAKPSGMGSVGAIQDDAYVLGPDGHPMKHRQMEPTSQELQQRLFAAGIISEIKPPITDLTPYQNRQAIPVQGEPLSEAVIRERR